MKIIDKRFSLYQKIIENNPSYKNADYGWVLMFHEVVNNIYGHESNITISKDHFIDLIDNLKEEFTFQPLDGILRNKNGHQIFITFDDVYESMYLNVFNWLEKQKIPFTCFISPGLIGKKGYISNNQLISLSKSKYCTLAFHGKNHLIMRGLNKDAIKDEIVDISPIIQNNYDNNIFAYPYGSIYAIPKEAINICEKYYSLAFGTISLPLNAKYINNNKSYLPRINVNNTNYNKVIRRIKDYSRG